MLAAWAAAAAAAAPAPVRLRAQHGDTGTRTPHGRVPASSSALRLNTGKKGTPSSLSRFPPCTFSFLRFYQRQDAAWKRAALPARASQRALHSTGRSVLPENELVALAGHDARCTDRANRQVSAFQLIPACCWQRSADHYYCPFQLEASSRLGTSSCPLRAVFRTERFMLWKIVEPLLCVAETSFQDNCCMTPAISPTGDHPCHTNAFLK